ncbi:MAG TPA: hypothetical protein VHL34_24570 [Rhizomicrobium sp.]|jgi:hypothetical protein|nr:hypothetical protein [Rhizomicrobium sp.]
MPIDASIYGNLQLPKLATLGEIAEARAQREERQMIRDSRKLAMDKQQREATELQAIQDVFAKHTGPDGPDQTAIVNELFRIAPDAAQKVQSGFAKLKKEAADARASELDAETKRIAAVSRSLQGVTPDTYAAAFSRIRTIDPEAAEVLGPTYDPAKVDAVMSSGMAWSDYNTKYKDVLASKEKDETKALNLISLANDQQQYEDALDFAKVHGVASKLREMGFADRFQPEVAQRAADLSMTPKERQTAASAGSGGSDYARFEADYLAAEAAKIGKTAAQLSPPERVRLKTAARKVFGQADDRPSGGSAGMTPYAESNVLNRLNTQWQNASKPAVELNRQVKLMDAGLAAARRGDMAQGAQAILVTFQKILDPTSVVRESEYMRSAAGQSLDNRVRGYMEQLAKGGAGVPLAELEKFARLAKEAAKAQSTGYVDSIKARIGRSADHFNIPRDLVFEDFNLESGQSQSGGTVAPPSGRFNPATGKVEPVQ